MNVTIKTAHGFLSFQPNGSIEYRQSVGPWEVIDIDGLTLPQPVPPGPGPGPGPVPPVGPIPTETAVYVAQVKAWLQGQGADLSGPCGAFLITKHVAWGLRDRGFGLLSKPAGNNCDGYAVDIVMRRQDKGAIIDILGDAGNANVPIWNDPADVVDPARWRPPVQP